MKATEIINENIDTYINSFINSVADAGFLTAFSKAKTDSRIRDVAKGWLDAWQGQLNDLKNQNGGKVPTQQVLQNELSGFVHVDMKVPQSKYSKKGIRELVDYSTSGQIGTNKSLTYMTALFTLSLVGEENIEPEVKPTPAEIENIIPFGEPIATDEKKPGNIIPVKVVKADGATFIKYDGLWFYDTNDAGAEFKLSLTPVNDNSSLESAESTEIPVRVGPSSTRTLEILSLADKQNWLDSQVEQAR